MSSDNLPAVRQNQSIVQKKETDWEIVDSRSTELTHSPLSSFAGQVVKTAVYAALDWFSKRHASERNLMERGGETPRIKQINTRQSLVGGKSRSLHRRSTGRRIRQRRRRWQQR